MRSTSDGASVPGNEAVADEPATGRPLEVEVEVEVEIDVDVAARVVAPGRDDPDTSEPEDDRDHESPGRATRPCNGGPSIRDYRPWQGEYSFAHSSLPSFWPPGQGHVRIQLPQPRPGQGHVRVRDQIGGACTCAARGRTPE
jgi:hypothetical protein